MAEPPAERKRAGGQRGGWLAVLAVAWVLVLAAGLLLVLPIGYLGVVVVLGGFLFLVVVTFHYLVWGLWMTKALQKHREDDDSSDNVAGQPVSGNVAGQSSGPGVMPGSPRSS